EPRPPVRGRVEAAGPGIPLKVAPGERSVRRVSVPDAPPREAWRPPRVLLPRSSRWLRGSDCSRLATESADASPTGLGSDDWDDPDDRYRNTRSLSRGSVHSRRLLRVLHRPPSR